VSRDNEPVKGQWYENVEDEETFRVLSVDEDAEMIEIEYLDGEIEELDLEEWHEFDLELIDEPEGWSEDDDEEEEDDDEEEWDDEDDDEDDDWDEDEDEDEDYDDDGRER
jgi:segregation and condensation protein B